METRQMTKAKIRPPRKPRNEPAKVTIANQDAQIRLLIARVEQLTEERNECRREVESARKSNSLEREMFDATANELNQKTLAYIRLQGWQDCAREVMGQGSADITVGP